MNRVHVQPIVPPSLGPLLGSPQKVPPSLGLLLGSPRISPPKVPRSFGLLLGSPLINPPKIPQSLGLLLGSSLRNQPKVPQIGGVLRARLPLPHSIQRFPQPCLLHRKLSKIFPHLKFLDVMCWDRSKALLSSYTRSNIYRTASPTTTHEPTALWQTKKPTREPSREPTPHPTQRQREMHLPTVSFVLVMRKDRI